MHIFEQFLLNLSVKRDKLMSTMLKLNSETILQLKAIKCKGG